MQALSGHAHPRPAHAAGGTAGRAGAGAGRVRCRSRAGSTTPPARRTPGRACRDRRGAGYLRLHGPATTSDAAGFVGTTRTTMAGTMWPDDVVEVSMDGRRGAIPADALPALENPPEADVVHLLPPKDPLAQARDRALLVPDPAHRKEVWRVLGNPGTILVGTELAGVWRATKSGDRLELTMTALLPLPAQARTAADADRMRAARGLSELRLTWT
ncbi:crosslink repair DNA glycosylase YcaQ family protein [Saccharomonospora xinjiangensis]|uniref:DNA glycosylase AlkZ-like family protein n=1 Tax=Saccharomonospora xinjiangensis TaxID=75294 RepID=UPI0035101C3C